MAWKENEKVWLNVEAADEICNIIDSWRKAEGLEPMTRKQYRSAYQICVQEDIRPEDVCEEMACEFSKQIHGKEIEFIVAYPAAKDRRVSGHWFLNREFVPYGVLFPQGDSSDPAPSERVCEWYRAAKQIKNACFVGIFSFNPE